MKILIISTQLLLYWNHEKMYFLSLHLKYKKNSSQITNRFIFRPWYIKWYKYLILSLVSKRITIFEKKCEQGIDFKWKHGAFNWRKVLTNFLGYYYSQFVKENQTILWLHFLKEGKGDLIIPLGKLPFDPFEFYPLPRFRAEFAFFQAWFSAQFSSFWPWFTAVTC